MTEKPREALEQSQTLQAVKQIILSAACYRRFKINFDDPTSELGSITIERGISFSSGKGAHPEYPEAEQFLRSLDDIMEFTRKHYEERRKQNQILCDLRRKIASLKKTAGAEKTESATHKKFPFTLRKTAHPHDDMLFSYILKILDESANGMALPTDAAKPEVDISNIAATTEIMQKITQVLTYRTAQSPGVGTNTEIAMMTVVGEIMTALKSPAPEFKKEMLELLEKIRILETLSIECSRVIRQLDPACAEIQDELLGKIVNILEYLESLNLEPYRFLLPERKISLGEILCQVATMDEEIVVTEITDEKIAINHVELLRVLENMAYLARRLSTLQKNQHIRIKVAENEHSWTFRFVYTGVLLYFQDIPRHCNEEEIMQSVELCKEICRANGWVIASFIESMEGACFTLTVEKPKTK